MTADIGTRAAAARDALDAHRATIRDELEAARAATPAGAPDPGDAARARIAALTAAANGEPDPNDPDDVPADDWRDTYEPTDHRAVARQTLDGIDDALATVRHELAAVSTPADADRLEGVLRSLRIAETAHRVHLRDADARLEARRVLRDELAALVQDADAVVRIADQRASDAADRHAATAALRATIAAPPISTIAASAQAVASGAVHAATTARLEALLPDVLRDRARARADEARAPEPTSTAVAESALLDLAAAASPIEGSLAAADRAHDRAHRDLADETASASTRLSTAEMLLDRAGAHPDLSGAQVTAIDAASNADGVTAAAAEQELADAFADVAAAAAHVDDAILAALVLDPEADPEASQAVIDARAVLEGAALQDPLAAARAAYDDAAIAALDTWEVEVPDSLWDALADLDRADVILDELGDPGVRAELIAALDAAEVALADAYDAHAQHVARTWMARAELARRHARDAGRRRTTTARLTQFLRGDGPAGRTPTQR